MTESRMELGRALYSEHEIQKRIGEMGRQISQATRPGPLLVVGVLKGCVFFLADLVRQISTPLSYDFFQVSSYRSSTSPTAPPELSLSPDIPLEGRNVLLVEDIVDTGHTLRLVQDAIRRENPASLSTAVLLDKRERRKVEVDLDWVGFVIPNQFVVGYGMDYRQRWRNLPYLARVTDEWS